MTSWKTSDFIMDSVIVFFANATVAQVEAAASPFGFCEGMVTRGEEHFFLWRYSSEEQAVELDELEARALVPIFGSAPRCAFQVASRYGASARFALEVVNHLMAQFSPAALDDDYGHLLSSADVQSVYAKNPVEGIYAFRDLTKPQNT